MEFQRLTSPDDKRLDMAMALYRNSFPPHEQRTGTSQKAILNNDDYHFDLIYEGTLFIGLLLYWQTNAFIYVEHFCIAPELRGKKYGQRALANLSQKGLPIILEIDPPVEEVSIRRKAFYTRAGYVSNPFPHIHPPYHPENKGHSLEVMSHPQAISPKEYEQFRSYLENVVMRL